MSASVRRMLLPVSLLGLLLTASLGAQTHVIVVTGASGEPQYAASFHKAASTFIDALVSRHGFTRRDITYLAEDPSRDTARIDGKSSKQELTRAVAQVASRGRSGDRVLVLLIGHGSHAARARASTCPVRI